MPPQTTTTHKIRGSVGRRAELLADRIEEGAAGLAAFAELLSEAEWLEPVSGTDRRSVGVIVHHVASVYPIEIDVARAIASGKAVTDVTWDVVAELNAKHAHDQAGVTKAAALELLWPTLRADSAVQAKNIGQGLVMSGMMRSSPGTAISSFMSSSASQSWQPV